MNAQDRIRPLRHLLFLFLLAAFLVFPARVSADTSISVTGKQLYTQAYQVLAQTNAIRKSVGVAPLTMDMDLMKAAMQRAAEISVYFSHTRPNGADCYSVCEEKMYGENLAMGTALYNATEATTAWKNSAGHYRNMVDPDFTTVGIGCLHIGNNYCWVQCFGLEDLKTGSKPADSTKTFTVRLSTSVAAALDIRTVTFRANGGSFSKTSSVTSKSISVFNGAAYGSLPSVYRKGYTFCGWYTKKSGGTKITSSKKVSIASGKTQTLYAHWKKISVGKATLSRLAKKSGGLKVSGAAGYEISICTSKKFPKASTKTKVVKKSCARSVTFSGLKKGTWYCRVRAYKTDSAGNRIYGKYSAIKKLKLK